jgi:transcription initiation factor TFIIH subunit 4
MLIHDKIISFLGTHAHPEMKKFQPIIPETIIDQIRLWEMEKNRIRLCPGYLYENFLRQDDYEEVLKYARGLNYVLWNYDLKRLLVISEEGHDHVKAFVKQRNGT